MKKPSSSSMEERLRQARLQGRSALVPFCLAGHPSRERFAQTLLEIAELADLIEIGLPFSDPVADGPVIADVSRERAAAGVHLSWLFECLESIEHPLAAPPLLFSYLNPILAYGFERALERMAALGFAGLVIPELPLEESEPYARAAARQGLDLVQLVTPLTPPDRRRAIAEASQGFVYAVLRNGITGASTDVSQAIDFVRELRRESSLPVCAGFGLGHAGQVHALKREVDGLIVGSALVAHLEAGRAAGDFLHPLFQATKHEDE